MPINLTIDDKSISEIQRMLGPKNAGIAMQAALSRTVTTGVALISRRIGEEVRLPIARIKESIIAKRGSYDSPKASIQVSKGKSVWLSQFLSAAQKQGKLRALAGGGFKQLRPRGGVTVRVRKRPTPKYPTTERRSKAFVESMPKSSYTGIFERTGIKRVMKSGRYKGKVREVIHRLRGPSPLGVFVHAKGEGGARTIFDEVSKKLADVFQKNLMSQIDRFVKRRGLTAVPSESNA